MNKKITLSLDEEIIKKIKKMAIDENTYCSTIINLWLEEKLEQIDRAESK